MGTIDKNDMVAMGAIWSDRVKVEQQRAREFDGNWGFLTAKNEHGDAAGQSMNNTRKECPPPNFEYTKMLSSTNVKKLHLWRCQGAAGKVGCTQGGVAQVRMGQELG